VIGSLFIIVVGLSYLEWRRRAAAAKGEGYGTNLLNEPQRVEGGKLPPPLLAILPLIVVGVSNFWLTRMIPLWYGEANSVSLPGLAKPVETKIASVTAIWAVEGALLLGIVWCS
jgi:H+/gluconate symporter-like permease